MAYLPLSTANLPDPVIDPAQGASPEDYFNPVLYSGSSSAQSITGVGFQPDWVWVKSRSNASSNALFDRVRGAEKRLRSDTTDGEDTNTGVTSFDTDGFSIGTSTSTNGSGRTFVAWNWKANGSGVSNTDGSITSTVSANTTSGFSIVSYTGNSTAGATVGHGLDATPDMFIVKNRDRSADWHIYHTDLGATKNLKFTTASVATQAGVFNNTEPTSTVFSLGTNSALNASNEDIIAYCFHSVEGFSKFGSYVGNGSTDGPFVYTGFRPAFLLVKNTTYADQWWILVDNTRSVSNPVDDTLFPNISNAEQDNDRFNFLSNGFKVINNYENINRSGDTFIYMAFAENPFKYSNAR